MRIFRALAEVASEQDATSVKVAQVRARAGVTRKQFDAEFDTLEDCFLAALEWGVRRGRAAMADAYTRESGWVDAVRGALAALLELLDEEPALARLWVVYSLGGGPRVVRYRAEVVEVLCRFVDRGRRETVARSEPPALTAEGVVGAVLAVIQTRLLARGREPLSDLLGQLMGLILLPYMGPVAVRRELRRAAPRPPPRRGRATVEGLGMRITYRTARVLTAIAERPGASNREVADRAGVVDQGQISKLLSRLEDLGMIANVGGGGLRGAPNAWTLTPRGEQVEHAIRRGTVKARRSLPQ